MNKLGVVSVILAVVTTILLFDFIPVTHLNIVIRMVIGGFIGFITQFIIERILNFLFNRNEESPKK